MLQSSQGEGEAMVLNAGGRADTGDERQEDLQTWKSDNRASSAEPVILATEASADVVAAVAVPSSAADLRRQMEEAVTQRDYARAAELDNQLKQLEAAAGSEASPLDLPPLQMQGSKPRTTEEPMVVLSSSEPSGNAHEAVEAETEEFVSHTGGGDATADQEDPAEAQTDTEVPSGMADEPAAVQAGSDPLTEVAITEPGQGSLDDASAADEAKVGAEEEGEDAEEEEDTEEEEEEGREIKMLIAACNRSFVPTSYPEASIGFPLIELAEGKNVSVVCVVSESWAADTNGTMCQSMVKEADLRLSAPIQLVAESNITSQLPRSFDAIIASGCATHHGLTNGPWELLAPLLKRRGLAQISVLNKAHKLNEMRTVLDRLNHLVNSSRQAALNQSESEQTALNNSESNSTVVEKAAQAQEQADVERAVVWSFRPEDESRAVTLMDEPASAIQTLLHAPMQVEEMTVDLVFERSWCAGLQPVSLDTEAQYQFSDTAPALEGVIEDESQLLKASEKLPWESQVALGELIRGTAKHHTLYARPVKRHREQCTNNAAALPVNELKASQVELAAAFPMFPAQLTANMSTAFVTAYALAELDHNVFRGELELGEQPVTVLAIGGGSADFAVSTAFQLSVALGADQASELSSVIWLDDDLTGTRRELVQKQSDSLGLTNFQIIDKHSEPGEAVLTEQYSYVHLGELEADTAAETVKWARQAATMGVGLQAHSAVRQESRIELQQALTILSSVVSMTDHKQLVHAAANLLQHVHQGHRHAARYGALNTGGAIAQATVPTYSALDVPAIYNLAELAGFEVAGFHDQVLYSSALATLSEALIESNASRVADLVQNAPMLESLALGELVSSSGVPVHYVQLSPRGAGSMKDTWRMEAVPLPMPTVKASDLARSLEGVNGKVQITCHAQGIRTILQGGVQ